MIIDGLPPEGTLSRHAILKGWWGNPCGFESPFGPKREESGHWEVAMALPGG